MSMKQDVLNGLYSELESLKNELSKKEKELNAVEIDPDKHEDSYRDMLNDCYGPVKIGSLEYDTAQVLEAVDPTAYRCGLNDYVDGLDVAETEEYKQIETEINDIEDRIEEIEAEVEELQSEQVESEA